MLISFVSLPAHARIWIFQSAHKLSEQLHHKISADIQDFISTWKSHDHEVSAGYAILENTFVIIGAEDTASGCSVDKLHHFVQHLNEKHHIDLLDRRMIIITPDGTYYLPLPELRNAISEGKIMHDDYIYMNNITQKHELQTLWKIKISDSFLKKYLPQAVQHS
ncbi:MAG: hypothetical protein NW207_05765 [Cytophagales bacterium]|nr:hypothetical protein [Cytophagales bacterium]